MKKDLRNDYETFVIRKSISPLRRLVHFILFTALWIYVAFVLVVNFAFLFGFYSDDFVSFYLLLNLNYDLYIKLLIAIAGLIIITAIYSTFRLVYLRRLNKNVK
ncbi:hypothetical protein NX776_06955 [Apilactobacillus kunkeei]|uniref:hypothetical protein n=1 Tax=Apilactobacillus TaxID=2767877 RepID=UPI0018DE9AB2|nr:MULTISPECIES: hypothetical protein [Apilactobacillus]MBI0092065.1 hypothetical protein [Lactobacillus sp. M0345]MBX8455183.1 hypothetical protein [Apilactobacillus kunkeei]MCK8619201.1 hypothetical protein [Apilactobacillus kunkeei]MCX0326427.1 hypothetical protein [Apilactobacillus kunkeei]MDN2613199.1 hypothetical protein [Apilactobacillus sp. EABW-1NA]